MQENVDLYLSDTALFKQHLDTYLSLWKDHLIYPLAVAYERSEKRVDMLKSLSEARYKKHQAALKKIEQTQQIVIGICFIALDLYTASAASRLINVQRKFSSKQSFDAFRNSSQDFESAWKAFTNQSDTWADSLLGNLDSTLRSQISTDKAKSAISVAKVYTADVSKSAAAVTAKMGDSWAGKLEFMINLMKFFTTAHRSIYEAFTIEVQMGKGSADHKRFVVERLVETPFCRPPRYDLQMFLEEFTTFFEISRYVEIVESTRQKKKNFGILDDYGGFFCDAMNERLVELVGHYFTHRGGSSVTPGEKKRLRSGDVALSRPLRNGNTAAGRDRDFRLAWDGFCSHVQSAYAKKIMATAREFYFDTYIQAVGVDAEKYYIPKNLVDAR